MAHALGFVIISFFYIKFYTFLPKYLVSSFFCCIFAANIPIMEYGLGCPRLEGLSVLAVFFLFVRYNFYAYLFRELLVKVRQIVISTLIYVQIVFLHYVTNCSISFFCEQGSTQ